MPSPGAPAATSADAALPKLYNIQYLRGVAALGVVAFHAGLAVGVPLNSGAFGVDIFFVISGFLMVAITDERSRPWPFLRDRILRVVPLYWLATAMAVAVFALDTGGGRPAGARILTSLLFLPWGEPGLNAKFFPLLNVGWTLNYEMLFYTLFAAALFFPRRSQLWLLAGAFAALAAARSAAGPASLPWGFWGHPLIFEFLAGAFLAAAWRSPRRWALPALTSACLLGAMAAYELAGTAQDGARLPTLLFASAIVGIAVQLERPRRPLRLPLLFGDASYSIYLWHVFAIRAAVILAGPYLPTLPLLLFCFATGAAAGIGAYLVIERPIMRALRRPAWARGAPVPGGV